MSIDSLNEFVVNNELPTLGFLFLRQDKNSNKAPFGEIIIQEIIKPNELYDIWKVIINEYINSNNITLYQAFNKVKDNNKISISNRIDIAIEQFFQQKNNNDELILQSIKIKDNTLDKGNSKLLWFYCYILEYISSYDLIFKGKKESLHNFLQPYTFFRQSVAYKIPINLYLEFRKSMKESSDYNIGNEARENAFNYLKNSFISSVFNDAFKPFSEEAWRDLLCTVQFNYESNNSRKYKVLMHLLWEKIRQQEYSLIDFDTEVKWEYKDNNSKRKGRLDAFLNFKNENSGNYEKIYIEFKSFNNELKHIKDVEYQPFAVLNNQFEYERYYHYPNDEWKFVAITKGTDYTCIDCTFPKGNYLDLRWEYLFEKIVNELYSTAIKSTNKSLLEFLNFLTKK